MLTGWGSLLGFCLPHATHVHHVAVEIPWAVLLPVFFQSPAKETATTSIPLQQSHLLTD